jgi:penicillin-insensitive murein endopeptidase
MLSRRFGGALALLAAAACACAPTGRTAANVHGATSEVQREGSPPSEVATAEPPPDERSGVDPAEQRDGEGEEEEADEGVADEGADVELPPEVMVRPPHPFANLSDSELEARLVDDPASLGSMSVGRPNAGLLFNGKIMPAGDGWELVDPSHAYGTEETTEYLETAIRAVRERFPDTPKLSIGHISAKGGGYLRPHVSHQAGRDVDISYYYTHGARWYRRADANNLDVARTWAFVRALVTQTDVELLLIDRSIQKLLREYAEGIGEDRAWVNALFKGDGVLPPIIRHAPGHATHLHIRFYNPIAQETGRRLYSALVRHGLVRPGAAFVVHVAKKGETLVQIAKRYGTTVPAIRRANGLKSTVIQAKKAYRIPQAGHAPPSIVAGPIAIPPRRLPPDRGARAGGEPRKSG